MQPTILKMWTGFTNIRLKKSKNNFPRRNTGYFIMKKRWIHGRGQLATLSHLTEPEKCAKQQLAEWK